MGRPDWRAMLAGMSSTEYADWHRFYSTHYFHDVLLDMHFSGLTYTVLSLFFSDPDMHPLDFSLLNRREADEEPEDDVLMQKAAGLGGGNLPPRPFSIRMRRMTPDSTTDQLQNKTLWSSYTEIIDVKQCYPNTALVGVQVDSEQFGSQQVSRNYHLRGRILQVPSNYNPQTRQYSGIWDGTFKPAYSNNMAWCLWDMLTHPRYGMGKRLGAADVDKWALYVIGQYCDQSVPDGFGGTEP
ncbi:TPA: phage tail assembly protein T, partial [Escherichia coli]|nr:phage tail assembly protein T [Escherichia coli]